jgi:hypothetical protein
MLRNPLLLCITCILVFCSRVHAQTINPDTASMETAFRNTAAVYKNAVDGYNNLYNGKEYIGSYPGTTGHPNFAWDSLQRGAITYGGVYYPEIRLKYDLVSGEIVVLGKQNLLLSLIPEKIDNFSLENHVFVNVRPDSSRQRLEAGFYEVLYNGATPVLARHIKKIERASRVEDPYIFKQYTYFYIKKENVYYPVENENDLLRLLGNKKEALKRYLRESNANFKKNKGNSIVQTVAYYDQQKN